MLKHIGLNRNYSELWKNADPDLRKELESFVEKAMKVGCKIPDLNRSPASQAREFMNEYAMKEKVTAREYGEILNKILKRPEWLQWISHSELDAEDSAIESAVRQRDLSPDGIGMRLIHDAAFEINGEGGAYWKNVFFEATGLRSFSDINVRKTWALENGRLLNALSYLCSVTSALGEGGNEAMKDLNRWLSDEAPEFMQELGNEKKREHLWTNWDEMLPASLQMFLQINNTNSERSK